MFNRNHKQKWATTRCRSVVDLPTAKENREPLSSDIDADRLHYEDIPNEQQNRARQNILENNIVNRPQRSRSSNVRRSSIKEDLKRLWGSRPSLTLFNRTTRVSNDEHEGRNGRRVVEGDGISDDNASINSDLETMPAFFIVDRSLVRTPKPTKPFKFFRKKDND
ncbi:unnamed protein product [Cylicocyclus nassatus]|uniref:Uncharacterized protein n=1 Tax=Cylicocyclus nassatus TaxID=53992 RepID=A0AA36GHJ7_CYLNA|nr:unnamed protein product [Cylicocyclus nassatus]